MGLAVGRDGRKYQEVEDQHGDKAEPLVTPDGHCGTVDVKEKTTSIKIATCVVAFKDRSRRATL